MGKGIPRAAASDAPVGAVQKIIEDVRLRGDAALIELTQRFDGVQLSSLRVPEDQIRQAAKSAHSEFLSALERTAERIRAFSGKQSLQSWEDSIGGARIGEIVSGVPRAGIYVPGGRAAYPSSVLMGAIPASVACVEQIALCVPPSKEGEVSEATLTAARVAGVTEIYRVGGAQAIAALALGTESIAPVNVIVGPGNKYVAEAKRQLAGTVAIDSVAGPSEIAIVIDKDADPRWAAWDVVAQAEHGPAGSFVVLGWEIEALQAVERGLDGLLAEIDASQELRAAVKNGFAAVVVRDLDQAIECMNDFAPEHLELMFEGCEDHIEAFRSAGAIFSGAYSPVSVGDYVAGTNHVLPTGGSAAWASGLRTSHFQKATAVVKHDRKSLAGLLEDIDLLARAEGLPHHSSAARARFEPD